MLEWLKTILGDHYTEDISVNGLADQFGDRQGVCGPC